MNTSAFSANPAGDGKGVALRSMGLSACPLLWSGVAFCPGIPHSAGISFQITTVCLFESGGNFPLTVYHSADIYRGPTVCQGLCWELGYDEREAHHLAGAAES